MSSARPPQSRRALLVLFAALVLAACTPGGDDGGDGGDGGPVRLTIAANAIEGGKNSTGAEWISDYVIPTFQKRMADDGKDVTVEFTGSGIEDEDYKNQLVLDLRVQGGPDVFEMDGPWVGEFAQAGYIKPLAEVAGDGVDDWEGWSQISDTVAGIVEFEGQRYGIPIATDGRVLYYNKELFARAGLPADWQPASWEDILTAARQLKQRVPGVTPLQINAGTAMGEATTAQGVLPLLYGTGAREYDQDAKTWLGASPELVEVLEFYRTVYQEEQLGDPRLQQFADGRDRSFAQFAEGKIAILAEGDYFWRDVINPDAGIAPMQNRDQAVGYTRIPAREPGSGINGQDFVSLSGGGGRVINPNTDHPEEAWALLQFMHSREAYENLVERQAMITARNDINEATLTDPMLQYVAEQVLPITTTRAPLAAYPQISTALQEASGAAATGSASPQDAATAYQQAAVQAVGADAVAAAR